nr:SDR family NAD(P)-dependent oxidoreductase [Fimbriiglobus ruber]
MARRDLAGVRLLVTGASQGIGRALAVSAARRGCKVLASARSAALLEELVAEVRGAGGRSKPSSRTWPSKPTGRRWWTPPARASAAWTCW